MRRPDRSIVFGVVVAVVVVAALVVIVRSAMACRPSGDRAKMIERFKAAPLFAVASNEGQLVHEVIAPNVCVEGRDGLSPPPIELRREYKTSAVYGAFDVYQLRNRFDQPAAAAGWVRIHQGPGQVGYCTHLAGWLTIATVGSTRQPGILVDMWAADRGEGPCLVDAGA